MRTSLGALTVRGRSFLAAGLTAVVCAVVLGQSALASAGVLVAVLPLASLVLVLATRHRLALVRGVEPQQVVAGESARIHLTLTNQGRVPRATLLLDDHLPYVLGARPRMVVGAVGTSWRRHLTYPVRSDVRGRYETGPLTVRVTDVFGMVELGRTFRSTAPLTVTPRVVPLPAIALAGGSGGAGDDRPRASAVGSAEDVTVRDYRRGDDLRRVHWRSSARTGELMVRREEQPWQSQATVLLDNRTLAHAGQGLSSSLEPAVALAASVCTHLAGRGYAVRLVTADGQVAATTAREGAAQQSGPLLHALAVVGLSPRSDLRGVAPDPAQPGVSIAVLGRLGRADEPVLARSARQSSGALAVVLDVGRWAASQQRQDGSLPPRPVGPGPGAPFADTTPAALAPLGWRAVAMRPDDAPADVWRRLGAARAVQVGARG